MNQPLGKVHILRYIGSQPLQALIESPGGAVLVWCFDYDLDTGVRRELIVFLTDDEVEAVLARDATRVGMLEPIRHKMRFRHGYVALRAGDNEQRDDAITEFMVPLRGSEHDFFSELMRATRDRAASATSRRRPRMDHAWRSGGEVVVVATAAGLRPERGRRGLEPAVLRHSERVERELQDA
ncbi:hypothetical protein AB6N24_08710 [Cellulomonas sp. 179-A 4D5 NHS]|uniref:hypothetical protein n=1 Tax=Cellulomonas sp. 179-A 4D5 NHS TaxID=3142378 RepID=UPI0039A3CF3A